MRYFAVICLCWLVAGTMPGQEPKMLPALAPPIGSQTPMPRPAVFPGTDTASADQPDGDSSETWFHFWYPAGGLLRPRLSVRHDFGDGVGYTSGFTYLEGFVPLWQPRDIDNVFADLRVVNFDDSRRWEFNAGAGYRTHFDLLDTVLGVNLFYDGRHTDSRFFHQIGVGAEALFPWWEFRCNGYFIVGDNRKLAEDSGPLVTGIVGNQVLVRRTRVFDVAMGGLDAEIGAVLPVLPEHSPRVYIGYYHYSAEGMQSANGVRGRLEAWITPSVSVHFAVQNDAVFDTTVTGGLAFHLGGTPFRRDGGPRTIEERLAQRVVRDVNIVIAQQTVTQEARFVVFDEAATAATVSGSTSTPPDDPTEPILCFLWPPHQHHHHHHGRHHGHHHDDDHGHRLPPGFHHHNVPGHPSILCFYWPRGSPPPSILKLR